MTLPPLKKLPSPMPPARPGVWRSLILAYGAGALVGQVLILREILVLAQGRELRLALALWCWLCWTGLGSLLGGLLAGRRLVRTAHLGGLLVLLGLLLPGTVFLARSLPTLFSLPAEMTLSPGAGLILFAVLLAPFGLVSGFFFPWACRRWEESAPAEAVARVYALETLGAALGVGLLQFFLLGRFGNLGLALAAGLFLIIVSLLQAAPRGFATRLAACLSLAVLAALLWFYPPVERESRRLQWPGRHLLATEDSPYALLSAFRMGDQISFFANNLWQFSYPDPLSAEYQVQLGLLQHPAPRRVLLLGGGAAGLVPEIFKTPGVTRLDYVELDSQQVRLVQRLLPREATGLAQNSRLRLIYQDARRFLTAEAEHYDVILLALPEPANAQLNRFYTREFFSIVARRLEPRGVFGFALSGGAASLHPLRAAYLSLAYQTLLPVFPEVLALPGERVRFFAANAPGVLVADPRILASRLVERRLQLDYVREDYLLQDLSLPRQDYLLQVLKQQQPEINTDLNPRCYFYDLALSGLQEGLPLHRILLFLRGLPVYLLWGLLLAWTMAAGLLLRSRAGPRYLYQVFISGLGIMALEVLVLILYQIHLGYLYRQMGLVMAACMMGLAAGGSWGAHQGIRNGPRDSVRKLAVLQAGLALLSLLLAGLLPYLFGSVVLWGEGWVLTGYALILIAAGFGGGAVFALSANLWRQVRPRAGGLGGVLYATDLLGATLGTLGVSLVVLPVWGLAPALVLVAALHASAAVMTGDRGPGTGG